MAGTFLTRSRHGTIYYFRRRVPDAVQQVIGQQVIVKSLETSDRRIAVVRGRALAVQTDLIFKRIIMATKSKGQEIQTTYYGMTVDFSACGKPSKLSITDAKPEDEGAINSAIAAFGAMLGAASEPARPIKPSSEQKPFGEAMSEYFSKAQIKTQTKATYLSKLNHAKQFFGENKDVLEIDQADFVRYTDEVLATVVNITSQRHYITTVATFLNWYRVRSAGLPLLTTRTLVPKTDTPESEERDAFTLEQIGFIFENAKQYKRTNPQKFWVSIAPAFLGCRIEELCQVHLKTDLANDVKTGIWYFMFDARTDADGVMRKSMKKAASWRHAPIHSALVRHGFIKFLQEQQRAGLERPFQKEWKPRQAKSDLGQIIKWSHYVSRWGGRQLVKIAGVKGFDAKPLAYFHSMRHTFKRILGDAGVTSEISEALSGRRYGGADAERYEKLKQNHVRLSTEGIERGLDVLAALLDKCMTDPT